MAEESKLSRREFGRSSALAAAALIWAPGSVMPQPDKRPSEGDPQEKPPDTPPAAGPELPAIAKAEAQQHYAAVMQNYGSRFTEEQKKDIARLLEQQQRAIEEVRAFTLENGDEPATVLRFYENAGPALREGPHGTQ